MGALRVRNAEDEVQITIDKTKHLEIAPQNRHGRSSPRLKRTRTQRPPIQKRIRGVSIRQQNRSKTRSINRSKNMTYETDYDEINQWAPLLHRFT